MGKKVRIATIGDSLTQGNPPPNFRHPGTYQYWMQERLKKAGIQTIITNWGIGGQVAHEIALRVPQTIPTDILVIIGGTNDVWRYSSFNEEMSLEMSDDVVEQLASGAKLAKLGEEGGARYVLLCSVPPYVKLPTLPRDAQKNLGRINGGIKDLCKREGYHFCDVHAAMSLPDGTGNPKNFTNDGVHFAHAGNRACGEAVARCIEKIIRE